MSVFGDYMGFDRDDIVGIALGIDDQLYLEQVHSYAVENRMIDESGVDGSLSEYIEKEEKDTIPDDIDIDFSELEPEDDDVSIDGMDVEDYADSEYEILNGDADDDIELFDFVDMEDID